jgi:two-component system capsular synthesis sensor histidine kinase RcsC
MNSAALLPWLPCGIALIFAAVLLLRDRQRQRQLQRLNEMLAVLGHEIRSPLRALVADLDPAIGRSTGGAEARHSGEIRALCHHVLRVAEDSLEMARLEQGTHPLVPAPFDLERELEPVLATVRPDPAEPVRLAIEFQPGMPLCWHGDVHRIRQILINLLDNALAHTREGSVTLGFSATAAGPLRIVVRDTGSGIPAELRGRLFEPFVQGPDSGGRAGIGLAVVARLVERMGGRIELDSEPGRGSRFRLSLPLEPAAAAEVAPPESPEPDRAPIPDRTAGPGERAGAAPRVLIVDDHPLPRRVLTRMLRELGCSAIAAEDGTCAREIAEDVEECFDWVLLDRHMPGADGPTTARALRQCPATRHARLVLLVNDADEAAAAGVVDRVLIRPDGARGLRDMLATMLEATVPVSVPSHGGEADPELDRIRDETLLEDLQALAARLDGANRNGIDDPLHRMRSALRIRPDPERGRRLDDLVRALEQGHAHRARSLIHGLQTMLESSLRD